MRQQAASKRSYEDDLAWLRDDKIEQSYARWEERHRRSNPPPAKKLFQRNRAIISAYKAGATLAEIGEQYDLSFGRVRQILDSQGVDRRSKGGYVPKRSTSDGEAPSLL